VERPLRKDIRNRRGVKKIKSKYVADLGRSVGKGLGQLVKVRICKNEGIGPKGSSWRKNAKRRNLVFDRKRRSRKRKWVVWGWGQERLRRKEQLGTKNRERRRERGFLEKSAWNRVESEP